MYGKPFRLKRYDLKRKREAPFPRREGPNLGLRGRVFFLCGLRRGGLF